MNIFFIGMGNMGRNRLNSIKLLECKYNLNVMGFSDPNVASIKYNERVLYNTQKLTINYIETQKINFFIVGTPHNLIFIL